MSPIFETKKIEHLDIPTGVAAELIRLHALLSIPDAEQCAWARAKIDNIHQIFFFGLISVPAIDSAELGL